MKLNIGCGNRRLEGYTGVDAVKRTAADIVAPAWKIPLKSSSVEEILAIHLWEHFHRWECDTVISEWWRLLAPGGRLVLELPNLLKACQNVLDGRMKGGKEPDQLTLWALYGDPRDKDPYMCHRWAWSPASLSDFLAANGFVHIQEEQTQFHPAGREHRDMRITSRRA